MTDNCDHTKYNQYKTVCYAKCGHFHLDSQIAFEREIEVRMEAAAAANISADIILPAR